MNRDSRPMNKLLKLIPLWATVLLLACGGGGGGGDGGTVPPPVPSDPSAAQGFWSGQVNAQTTASAVLLPDGTAWNVLRTGTVINSLVRGTTTVSGSAFSISGQSFNIGGGAPAAYSVSGTLVPKATLTGRPRKARPATPWPTTSSTKRRPSCRTSPGAGTPALVAGRCNWRWTFPPPARSAAPAAPAAPTVVAWRRMRRPSRCST